MKVFVIIVVNLIFSSACFAQYGSYENHMLNQSMNSFFYYQASPRGFADPRSLRDTEHRAAISDRYHEELEYVSPEYQAHKQRMMYPMYNRQNRFLNYQYYNRYNNGSYLNSNIGFRIPYP